MRTAQVCVHSQALVTGREGGETATVARPADPEAPSADPSESPRPPPTRASRAASQIVVTVLVALVVLVALAWWVLGAPYRTTVAGTSHDCDAQIEWTSDVAGRRSEATWQERCDDARSDRRRTALLLGAGVGTVAAAISTLPSRRLTRARL